MKKKPRLFRKLVALAIAAFLALQIATTSLAINQTGEGKLPTALDKVDLSTETRILDEYLVSIQAFQNKITFLKKRTLTRAQLTEEKSAIAVIAVNLKRGAPEVERNIQSIVRKIKAAGLWARLSDIVGARLKDSAAFGIIKRNGGPNEWLELAASIYPASASEFIDKALAELNSKPQAKSVSSFTRARSSGFIITTVGYNPAVPRAGVQFVCLTHGVRTISKSLQGSSTRIEVEEFKVDCGER
jgi:hypothetical protein